MADNDELRAMLLDAQAQIRQRDATIAALLTEGEQKDAHVAQLIGLKSIPQVGDAPVSAPQAPPSTPPETGIPLPPVAPVEAPVETAPVEAPAVVADGTA